MGFYLLSYLCLLIFLLATGWRIYIQMTLPVHVRWELYPVQHETADRVAYGGSYLEGLNWWEKKRHASLWNEVTYMVPEILFLRGLWKENRTLWLVSFPFHFGMYLILAAVGLLMLHALVAMECASSTAAGGAARSLLDGLIVFTVWLGLILGTFGTLGVLCRRLADPELRNYSSFMDYFNLLFISLFFLSALATCLWADSSLEGAKAYMLGLLTGGRLAVGYVPGQSVSGAIAIVSASLLAAYIPLTHMSHMFMKYFLYHKVKWDDAPNRRGSHLEAALVKNLALKPTWQASHVGADGEKSWHDLAASAPKEKP